MTNDTIPVTPHKTIREAAARVISPYPFGGLAMTTCYCQRYGRSGVIVYVRGDEAESLRTSIQGPYESYQNSNGYLVVVDRERTEEEYEAMMASIPDDFEAGDDLYED